MRRSGGRWPVSPSDFRDTRPFGLMVTHVSPQWPMLILSQASGGNWRALEIKQSIWFAFTTCKLLCVGLLTDIQSTGSRWHGRL